MFRFYMLILFFLQEMDEENAEDVEMDDDYGVDHYASDGDNDDLGDDDREATF